MTKAGFKTSAVVALTLAGSMVVSGCGGVRDALGVNKYPPDEFAVVAKTPLIIPPNYNLRPPGANQPRPREAEPTQMALRALYPDANLQTATRSPAEDQLIRASGGSVADRNARSDLSPNPSVVNKGAFTEQLLFDGQVQGAPGVQIDRNPPQAAPSSGQN